MSLPFQLHRAIRLCSGVLCAVVIAVAIPNAALAWHGDGWRPRHFHGYYHHGGWGWGHWYRPAFLPPPPPFGVSVYPGYYSAPYPYYPYPPAYVPAPPSVSFGFAFGR